MKFNFLSESDQAYFIHKASTLVEALPYIREHSGDIIVMISDGLPECENSNGEILGYNKIKDTILSFSNESANTIKHSLIDLGNDWLGENKNQDDITFMIIKKN